MKWKKPIEHTTSGKIESLPEDSSEIFFVPWQTAHVTLGSFSKSRKMFCRIASNSADPAAPHKLIGYSPEDVRLWCEVELEKD